jgi:hypothetical protein
MSSNFNLYNKLALFFLHYRWQKKGLEEVKLLTVVQLIHGRGGTQTQCVTPGSTFSTIR